MIRRLHDLRHRYHHLRRFQAGAGTDRLVFYSEHESSWPHFAPLIAELTGPLGHRVAYVSSSSEDARLRQSLPAVDSYYVGSGAGRIAFFESLRNALVVMTMPDLGTFHIKRSRFPRVRYLYVHHSMVSTHMAYRVGAFDQFDGILCVGPHHVTETRARERAAGLPPKDLVEHGYGRLDSILGARETLPIPPATPPHILLAPSWGDHGLLETAGVEIVAGLLAEGFAVTVRPHPRTSARRPDVIMTLRRQFDASDRFTLDLGVESFRSMAAASVMISDWSGAALEYALGFERPVIFVDGPRKVNNRDYAQLGLEPLEVGIRGALGAVVPVGDQRKIAAAVGGVVLDMAECRQRVRALRNEIVFNVGRSAAVGAQAIALRFTRLSGS